MAVFGFFLFLSVVSIGRNWRSVRVVQMQRDMLDQMLESGQHIDFDALSSLLQPAPRPVLWMRWKVATLLVLACIALSLAWAYREEGTMPLVIAAAVALLVAGATWQHERKVAQLAAARLRKESEPGRDARHP